MTRALLGYTRLPQADETAGDRGCLWITRFSLAQISVVAAMLVAVRDLRRLAVPYGLPHPFRAPPQRGSWSMKLHRQVSFREAVVSPAGWVIKGPAWCLAVTNKTAGTFMTRLTRTRP